MPSSAEPLAGEVAAGSLLGQGRYRVEQALAGHREGGYRAVDTVQKAERILWRLDFGGEVVPPCFEAVLQRLELVRHPRIRSVLETFVEGGAAWLVLEPLEGRSLLDLLSEPHAEGIGEDLAIDLGRQMLAILRHLHAASPPWSCGAQLPACLLITPDYQVHLVDFGVGALRESLGLRDLPPKGLVCCLPVEVSRGMAEPRSDLYAVGAIMYLLLAGRRITGFGFPRIRSVRPDLSSALEDVLDRALRLIPDNRYSSVREMALALERLARARRMGTAKAVTPEPRPAPASRPRRSEAAFKPAVPETRLSGVSRLALELERAIRLVEHGEIEPAPTSGSRTEGGHVVSPRDGSDMVTIPEGEYAIGSGLTDLESPEHRVYVRSFRIARAPVTNRQFEEFVSQSGYRPQGRWRDLCKAGLHDYPALAVTWEDAMAYCRWAGVRLPTEVEWEAAARGLDARPYPWGQAWLDNLCNWKGLSDATLLPRRPLHENGTGVLPPGCFPRGATPLGVLDLLGNVWEWCSTLFRPYPYVARDGREGGELGEGRVLRGGSWKSGRTDLRCSARRYLDPLLPVSTIGFRVASD